MASTECDYRHATTCVFFHLLPWCIGWQIERVIKIASTIMKLLSYIQIDVCVRIIRKNIDFHFHEGTKLQATVGFPDQSNNQCRLNFCKCLRKTASTDTKVLIANLQGLMQPSVRTKREFVCFGKWKLSKCRCFGQSINLGKTKSWHEHESVSMIPNYSLEIFLGVLRPLVILKNWFPGEKSEKCLLGRHFQPLDIPMQKLDLVVVQNYEIQQGGNWCLNHPMTCSIQWF